MEVRADGLDDLPPATVITNVVKAGAEKLLVRGTTSDNGTVKRVIVDGLAARAVTNNFAEWEIVLDLKEIPGRKIEAYAEDMVGNIEKRPHVVQID